MTTITVSIKLRLERHSGEPLANRQRTLIFQYVVVPGGEGGECSPTIPIRVCAAQRGRDLGTPDLERGIHFRDVS